MKKVLIVVSCVFLSQVMYANAYFFGLKSFDNSSSNIQNIEETFDIYVPVVSFIYDDRTARQQIQLQSLESTLGPDRIYHMTLSPLLYSAQQVANGAFDAQYRSFFSMVKAYDLKVIFRTMHEANGGWYPWAGFPDAFKKAWRHVHDLARSEGLTQNNILFDFSVNHWDMPFVGTDRPSQQAELLRCDTKAQQQSDCLTFEDYYPGDEYVDIVGVTFYNWGKGNSDRKWYTPYQILYDAQWNTLGRLRVFGKPLIVDEVATSAIWYDKLYDRPKSQALYATSYDKKNQWIVELSDFLHDEKDVLGAVYFNVDYTKGLQERYIGEADWAAINMSNGKVYTGIFHMYDASSQQSFEATAELFGQKVLWKNQSSPIMYHKYNARLLYLVRNVLEDKLQKRKSIVQALETLSLRFSQLETLTETQSQLFEITQVLLRYYK